MSVAPTEIHSANVSEAWVAVVEAVLAMSGAHAFHLIVRVDDPTAEVKAVRRIVDRLLDTSSLAPINEVRNTVFPAAVARRYPEPADLAERYRTHFLPRLRRLDRANRGGTYFGRFVDYPTPEGAVDQLTVVVDKLRRASGGKKWKAIYEIDMADGLDLAVYQRGEDERKLMAFPCLSFCSFQLDGDRLHMLANYRSQYLVQRAYGNYLGLGQLLEYVATAADLRVGQLLIVAGHAAVEAQRRLTRAAVNAARHELERV
ncbi:MAG: hypothetical protein ACXV8R_11545 [Acidimicrobiia bacterium]